MPKATLTFNLPEEQVEFKDATQAASIKSAIYQYDQHLRSIQKHGSEEVYKAFTVDEARKILWEYLTENEISFDDLVR